MNVTRVFIATSLILAVAARAMPGVAASPPVSIANAPVVPGEPLLVSVACAKGTGAGDLRSPVFTYTVLDLHADGRWSASPRIATRARPGAYALTARCTPGPGSPYATSTATFGVSPAPQIWSATSTTAISVTGDLAFTPKSIAFASSKTLAIRYLNDVSGHVSFVGDAEGTTRAELYRVTSLADPVLRSGNRFCGQRPTFVSLIRARSATGTDVFLTVYSGSAEPSGKPSDHVCAGYTYTL